MFSSSLLLMLCNIIFFIGFKSFIQTRCVLCITLAGVYSCNYILHRFHKFYSNTPSPLITVAESVIPIYSSMTWCIFNPTKWDKAWLFVFACELCFILVALLAFDLCRSIPLFIFNVILFLAATGRVTTKVDVYAFGVVLMELITGKKALDDSVPDERSHLVTWFRRVLINKENVPKTIDQTLNPDEETMLSIYKVAELAGHCTAREPYQRPDMGHAVNVLVPLVEQWKPSIDTDESGYGVELNLPRALQRWQNNEGTSTTMFNDMSISQTQSSLNSKPPFADSFGSTDCR